MFLFRSRKKRWFYPALMGRRSGVAPALDPETKTIYVNSNEMAWTAALFEDKGSHGAQGTYLSQCSVCHGDKMAGSPPAIPPLTGIGNRLSPADITTTIRTGKGRMPGFPNLHEDQLTGLVNFLLTGENTDEASSEPRSAGMKYRLTGYRRFLDPDGYPAIAPPWGTLNAIDLNTGQYKWKINLGEYPELAAKGMKNTGSENYGGPVVTAGGLLFIGATNYDKKFRAFDKATGEFCGRPLCLSQGTLRPSPTWPMDGNMW